MPTTSYTNGERYFFIASQTMLDTELPEAVKDKLGYEIDLTLEEFKIE